MPYVNVRTNKTVSPDLKKKLLSALSLRLADELGKPERYVMAEISGDANLVFAGSDEPTAYVELKSIGLSETQTQPLSSVICSLLSESLGVPSDRIYIEFINAPRKFWGWNQSTF